MQIFPVTAIWGHLCGFAMTATTAIPEAVLTGFAFKMGINLSLYSSGMADNISTILGAPEILFFFENSAFIYDKFIF